MIDLETARQIAYAWHGGGGSPLYSFASTSNDGQPRNVTQDTVREAKDNLRWCLDDAGCDPVPVAQLRDFLTAHLPAEEESED